MPAIRRLKPGDEPVLAVLARDEPDFDLPDEASPRRPPSSVDAAAYLADPGVLHWVAEDDGRVVGHLLCYLLRRRAGAARELMLHEIGVRTAWRRRGVGRALLAAMDAWMAEHGVASVWVLTHHPAARAFYEACGFTAEAEPETLLARG